MLVHTVFDLAAWLCAFAMGVFVARRHWLDAAPRTPLRDPGYFIALGTGAIAGALLFGQHEHEPRGHLADRTFDCRRGCRRHCRRRTLQAGAPAFAARPAASSWHRSRSASSSGASDAFSRACRTTPTERRPRCPGAWISATASRGIRCSFTNPPRWRCFWSVYLTEIARGSPLFLRQGFYLLVGFYALQRFIWEFFKPYPARGRSV